MNIQNVNNIQSGENINKACFNTLLEREGLNYTMNDDFLLVGTQPSEHDRIVYISVIRPQM